MKKSKINKSGSGKADNPKATLSLVFRESLYALKLIRKGKSLFLLERSVDYGLTFFLLCLALSRAEPK
jgi:hypothetical protein